MAKYGKGSAKKGNISTPFKDAVATPSGLTNPAPTKPKCS